MTKETQAAEIFTAASGIDMTYHYIPHNDPIGEFQKTRHFPMFRFSITLSKGNVSHTFEYSMGCGHCKIKSVNKGTDIWSNPVIADEPRIEQVYASNKMPTLPYGEAVTPELTDALYCLVMDSDAIDYPTFEDWASNFGYDEDSREAEKAYKACLETALKLRQLVDIDKAREAFQDY